MTDFEFKTATEDQLNKSQLRALNNLKRELQENADRHSEYGPEITIEMVWISEGKRLSVTGEVDLAGLGEGNLLRFLSNHRFHVFIGPRGKMTVKGSPKSFDQFKGGTVWMGNQKAHVDKDCFCY